MHIYTQLDESHLKNMGDEIKNITNNPKMSAYALSLPEVSIYM